MIASNAAVPNGLMNAIRRSTASSMLPRAPGFDRREARAVDAERRQIDGRLAAADEVGHEATGRRARPRCRRRAPTR